MAGYLAELTEVRGMLDQRFDDLNAHRVKPIAGEEALNRFRQKTR
ncbi:MAG TPA: hypothetical protein VFO34_05545 [Candidatus Acidoferrales bacterium]|nr:hypothetical protein [Candidatus Acidoferrales bacterium]